MSTPTPVSLTEINTSASERSDVTAVAAMGVIAEAMTALVLAHALLEKFGGDALSETKRNYDGYMAQLKAHSARGAAS